MTDNEINMYARSIREAAGLPVSPFAVVDGPPLTNAQRVIAALVHRLGGVVALSDYELENVSGMILEVRNGTVWIETQQ